MDPKKENSKRANIPEKEDQSLSKGELLKSTRVKKGLSLEIVQEETKIPLDALRAIEEGYTIRSLSDFYYNGFLKIYARYLKIDVNQVVDRKPKQFIKSIAEHENESFNVEGWLSQVLTRKTKQKIVIIVGMLLSLFVLFKVITLFTAKKKEKTNNLPSVTAADQNEKTDKVLQVKQKAKEEIPKTKVKARTLTTISQIKKQDEKKDSVAVVISGKESSSSIKTEAKSKSEPHPSTEKSVSSVIQAKEVSLTVRATKNSWLRVEIDGQVEFQSTLKLGSVETWFADKEIVISGRNITYLEFELNGKMIGKLGRKNRKVKEVTITKDGLRVSK